MIKTIYRFLHPRFQTLFLEYPVDMKPRHGHGAGPALAGLLEIVEAARPRYRTEIAKLTKYKEQLSRINTSDVETNPVEPIYNNGFLPGLDIAALYGILAENRPRHYVEIGSGNSTKVAHRARRDLGLGFEITSIDPAPRAEIDQLADHIIRQPFERCELDLADFLEPGDVLFVDNSHRILPNSDATVFFLEVLPRLRPGVIVHVHDIYIPYDYNQEMCDRFYSEQYGLAIFMLASPERLELLLPNFFISEDAELAGLAAPLWESPRLDGVERHGTSFWFRVLSK